MTRLTWDNVGERFYETGVDRGVLYPKFLDGVAWSGLISVTENSSGGESDQLYYDGVKYLDFIAAEEFGATIEAFSAPAAFAACDGQKALSPGLYVTNQPRLTFGLCYRTQIGNDLKGLDLGYKLHLVYNATALPADYSHKTVAQNVEPDTRSWSIVAVGEDVGNYRPTAHLIIDSTKVAASKLTTLENALYGTPTSAPTLPLQSQVAAMLA